MTRKICAGIALVLFVLTLPPIVAAQSGAKGRDRQRSDGAEGGTQQLPSAVEIVSVTISSVPFTDADGERWDDFFGGPDVFWTLVGEAGEVLYESAKIANATENDFPVTMNAEVEISVDLLDSYFTMLVHDADVTHDEEMDRTEPFKLLVYSGGSRYTVGTVRGNDVVFALQAIE